MSYFHKILLRILNHYLIGPIAIVSPYNFLGINILKAFFINLSIKVRVDSCLKIQIQKLKYVDLVTQSIIGINNPISLFFHNLIIPFLRIVFIVSII